MLAVTLAAASIAVGAATADRAGGQATVAPPLTGETLTAKGGRSVPPVGTLSITADCNPPTGQPTISYTASGPVTVGPYPGTYNESGTVVLSRLTPTTGGVPVSSFQATFTITSSVGVVIGTKQLGPGSNVGFCVTETNARLVTLALDGVTYSADITTATGTCRTEGTAIVRLTEQNTPPPLFDFRDFLEGFSTGTPCLAICPPGDDEDNDGLTDHNENLFSTLLGSADSDFDGIADGNDDANGNGEDDEDEDDDDGCPDEDSDGDGEDDEDEDDDEDD